MGADPEVADVLGNTTLHYSAAYGHLKVIRTLIEHCSGGGMVDAPNRLGWKPVSYSCTFEAERYFVRLVAERDRRAQAPATAAAGNAGGGGGGVGAGASGVGGGPGAVGKC